MHSSNVELAQLLDKLDLDALARDMLARLVEAMPAYQSMSREELADVLDGCRLNLSLALRFLSNGALAEAELDALRESGRRRAAEAVRLEDILHAYRTAAMVVLEAARARSGTTDPRLLARASDATNEYLDLVTTAVVSSYLDARVHLNSEHERRARILIDRLAAGDPLDGHERTLADHLGFRLAEVYLAFAAALPVWSARERAQFASELRAEDMLAYVDGEVVAGVAHAAAQLQRFGRVGVHIVTDEAGVAELGAVLQDTIQLACAVSPDGTGGVHPVDEYLPELLLVLSPRIAAKVRARVSGTLPPELRETLGALVANDMDRGATARALRIHRNTLTNRLARIDELTGLPLNAPRSAVVLQLGLLAAELHPGD